MFEQAYQLAARILLAQAAQSDIATTGAASSAMRLQDWVVLVPNAHAGQALVRALVQESAQSVLLPPRVLTLPAWAQTVLPDALVLPDSRRAVLLYQALAARGWFDVQDLWPMALELGRLFDDLTRNALHLPVDGAAFAAQLAAAYGARAQTAIAFEARLVHELWYALSQDGAGISPAAVYAMQLATLASRADAPLFILDDAEFSTCGFDRQERLFLQAYAERAAVIPLRVAGDDAAAVAVNTAWGDPVSHGPLRDRARQLAQLLPHSPLQGRVQYSPTYGLEDEALAAEAQIRLWLMQDCHNIGVVVQDRLTARRLRALLERADILVADETGWVLDTTVASTGIMRWLELVRADFPWQDVLDVLQAQWVCADVSSAAREQALQALQAWLRRHGPVQGRAAWREVQHVLTDASAQQVLARLLQAGDALRGQRKRDLAGWLEALAHSLQVLGGMARLASDAAGQQILALLETRSQELRGAHLVMGLSEFCRWLDHELQGALFLDKRVDSPLVFTHLAASRWRPFDAVLILGADATQWSAAAAGSVFFNQAVRKLLGLSTQAEAWQQTERDLAALLSHTPRVRVLWQLRRDGEDNPLAAPFERLEILHQLAWGSSLRDDGLLAWRRPLQHLAPGLGLGLAVAPCPSPDPSLIPQQISVSAYRSLMQCPYQYFARSVLGLAAPDEIRADMRKSDYGEALHAILYDFHRAYPRIDALEPAAAAAALLRISQDYFARHERDNYFATAWRLRWQDRIAEYVEWQRVREQQGWYWQAGEVDAERSWLLDGAHRLTLKGRIDRMDHNGQGLALLDYKTSKIKSLKEDAEMPDESVQLAAYAVLADAAVEQAAYVSLDDGRIASIGLGDGLHAALDCCTDRLTALFSALYQGAGLPANGLEQSCALCEMRGLCRRDHW